MNLCSGSQNLRVDPFTIRNELCAMPHLRPGAREKAMDLRFTHFEILTINGAIFLCLVLVCIFDQATDIQEDIGERVSQAIGAGNLLWSGVEVAGQQVVLTGAAADPASRGQAVAAARSVWGVSRVVDHIAVVDGMEDCQARLDAALDDGRISFKAGRAELSESSYLTMAKVAEAADHCRHAKLQVAVHTDSAGDAAVNLKLSQRRAEVVRRQLVRNGVQPSRLTAVGYGEKQPRVRNATAEGRRANRRVEFRVLEASA